MSTNESPIAFAPIYHRKGLIGYHFPGNGAPIFCLHGFGGSGQDFEALAAALKGRAPIIALNLPGHRGREANADGIQRIAEDIQQVTAEPIRLLGYSMGGRFALRLALEALVPVKSLILIGTTPGVANDNECAARAKFEASLAHRLRTMSQADFQDWWSTLPIIASQSRMPSPFKSRMHRRRAENDLSRLEDALNHFGTGSMRPMWTALHNVTIPTQLYVGKDDHKYLKIAQDMQERMPNAVLEVIPHSGHAPHLETPALMANRLLATSLNRRV